MKLKVGDIVKLKDGRKVRIEEIRDDSYAYPIWFIDVKTWVAGGCKWEDIEGLEEDNEWVEKYRLKVN